MLTLGILAWGFHHSLFVTYMETPLFGLFWYFLEVFLLIHLWSTLYEITLFIFSYSQRRCRINFSFAKQWCFLCHCMMRFLSMHIFKYSGTGLRPDLCWCWGLMSGLVFLDLCLSVSSSFPSQKNFIGNLRIFGKKYLIAWYHFSGFFSWAPQVREDLARLIISHVVIALHWIRVRM